jgi:hypothetical protein
MNRKLAYRVSERGAGGGAGGYYRGLVWMFYQIGSSNYADADAWTNKL